MESTFNRVIQKVVYSKILRYSTEVFLGVSVLYLSIFIFIIFFTPLHFKTRVYSLTLFQCFNSVCCGFSILRDLDLVVSSLAMLIVYVISVRCA